MNAWLRQNGTEDKAINAKTCPQCKTPLAFTQRYSDEIKEAMNDVIEVKKKFYGSIDEIDKKRVKLQALIELIFQKAGKYFPKSKSY